MFIRTERLFLRPAWPEDEGELLDILQDDAALRNLSVSPLPRTEPELRAYLTSPRDDLLPHFAINLRDDEGAKLIGSVGLGRSGEDIELAYCIAREHRGRGFAAEAVRAVLAEARMLGHRHVVAAHFADNKASAQVLERSGFKPTGETRRRFSIARNAEAPARLYVAVLADKLFDLFGVAPQKPAPA